MKLADSPVAGRLRTGFALIAVTFVLAVSVTRAEPPGSPRATGSPESPEQQDEAQSDAAPAASGVAVATMTRRERALADLVKTGMVTGAYVTLGAGDATFLARYERAEQARPDGVILVVPRSGSFVGDDPLVNAYTAEFPANGWSVLAVQMPLLAQTAGADAYETVHETGVMRVREAFGFAATDAGVPVVVAGEASGAEVVRACLQSGAVPGAVGFAAIGHWQGTVSEVPLPVLEILGSNDATALERAAERARAVARNPQRRYEQILLAGAGRRLLGHEAAAARRLRGWIDRMSENAMLQPGPGG